MPRQTQRSAARGPLDKLRGPVRKMAEEVFSVDADRSVLKDEPLMNGLSELQTKQALKVLDTYCANVQRQGSGRIQNKAAYLMSLIQSYKLGPSSGAPGSAQRLVERLSPSVRRAVDGVFDPVVDRVVLEDRALMELLAKVPEEQALAALKKYRATVQRRGRDAIDNRCGYLIGFLKQYQDGVSVVGTQGQGPRGLSTAAVANGDGTAGPKPSQQVSSAANLSANHSNGARPALGSHVGGMIASHAPPVSFPSQSASAPGLTNVGTSGVRPISYLQPNVRKQLEKLFESGKDKAVLEDVGLIKQLARLGEEQALAALKNYKEASKHRRDIHNKSAYLMGILRGYIEGTTPISKAPWEGGGDDVQQQSSADGTTTPPPGGPSANGNRNRGRVPKANGAAGDDAHHVEHLTQTSQGVASSQASASSTPPLPPAGGTTFPVPGVRELGAFANAPAIPQQTSASLPRPASPSPGPSTMVTSPMGGGGLFLDGVGIGSAGGVGAVKGAGTHSNGAASRAGEQTQSYDNSNGLMFLDGALGGAVAGFGDSPAPTHEPPPRHASPHESLFGRGPGAQGQQALVGPGLLGGDFLANGGGNMNGNAALPSVVASSAPGRTAPPSNGALFGSGLLAGEELGGGSVGSVGPVPASPGSMASPTEAANGSTNVNAVSADGSAVASSAGSDAGQEASTSGTVSTSEKPVTGERPLISPTSGDSVDHTSESGEVGGLADMLARLNLSKYVSVLAEAEVDMDALRLFGEDDLKDLGFPKGPRIKLLHEVQNLNFTLRA